MIKLINLSKMDKSRFGLYLFGIKLNKSLKSSFFLGLFFATLTCVNLASANALPKGFVYVKEVIPTIQESIRYATTFNFTGKKIAGYKKAKLILTEQAAKALKNVQQELLENGYSLVIYDAYRPQKAVDFFIKWAASNDIKMKPIFFNDIPTKEEIFSRGYVAKRSGHSRGSTVDLTIISINTLVKETSDLKPSVRSLKNSKKIQFIDDNTLDMGSSFDLFDEASHHDTPLIEDVYLERRNFLRDIMIKHGFMPYKEEWWHYTLANEPFPDTYFNFDIK